MLPTCIECTFNPVCHIHMNSLEIQCALHPVHLGRWIGSGFKQDCIVIHDSCEVMPTMGSLACGTCCTAIFSSAIAAMLGKQEACFLMAEKSGTAW